MLCDLPFCEVNLVVSGVIEVAELLLRRLLYVEF